MATRHKSLRLFLIAVVLVTAILPWPPGLILSAYADDPPIPLPAECGGSGNLGTCCVRGYVYHEDVPVTGASVTVQSDSDSTIVTTGDGPDSNHPYYAVSLDNPPLNAVPGDIITITASYSDMVSARTWTVQSDGQHVDIGMVAGYQAPGPISASAANVRDATPAVTHDRAWTSATPQSLPLIFIENVGQFDERAHFQVRSGNTTLFLTDDALWITLLQPNSGLDQADAADLLNHTFQNRESEIGNRQGVNLKLSFVGANPHPRLEPFDKLDSRVPFFTGNDPAQWHTDVPAWGGVRYVDLHPGIDLEITSQNGQLVQRLIVRNGETASPLTSRPSPLVNVRLRVEGADNLILDGNHLRLVTALGDFSLPLLTVEGATPEAQPVISAADAAYQVSAPFVSTSALAIRATLASTSTSLCSTYIGGSDEDRAYDIALDNAGNVYITGQTSSTDFPTTPGVYDTSYNGNPSDVFVTKLSADGSALVYSTYLGGSSEDGGYSITVDDTGNVYVAGQTYSTDFPTTNSALDRMLNGGRDAFAAKLNATGDVLIYSTYLGGSSWEYARGIAVDGESNAYITGFTHGNFPTTPGVVQPTHGGATDPFVVKLNSDGSALVYSTYLGGSSNDGGSSIVVDGDGNAYLTGDTHSTDFPTANPVQPAKAGGISDAYVAKLNADGSALVYSTYLGGSTSGSGEAGNEIVIDSARNAYVTGATNAIDFPTVNPLQPVYGGGDLDAFSVKLNDDGSDLLYGTYLGGSGADRGLDIAIDGDGNAYVTGYTASTDLTTVDPLQATNAGGYDAFVAKVNDDGSTLLYSTYLGGSGDENCHNPPHGHAGIALDGRGSIYLTGFTDSTDFPTTPGAYDTSYNGGDYDVFVTKISMGECGWSLTGSLADGRHAHTATLLSDGRVLVVGGIQERIVGSPGLASAEIYDPISGTWSATGSLNTGRWGHTATLLPDGRVLVVGGRDGYSGSVLTSVEIYDPASGTWSPATPLSVSRGSHTATRLSDGRVLIVGGRYSTSSPDIHASTEIYDPTSGTWSPTGSLNTPRGSHSATLLSDGRVLVVNGYYQSWLASAEIYDPASGTWSEIPSPLSCHGVAHTATLLPDGRVLVVGGACGSGTPGISDGAEIYDPVASTWTATTDLPEAREVHTVALLPDGTVLVVGGDDGDVPRYDSALIYNPANGTWNPTGSLTTGRRNHTATLLDDGRVLVAAGWGDTTTYLDSAEIYHPCQISSPVAAFAAASLSGTAPLTVTFTDQSTGDITSWSWDFGDSGTSTDQNPTHTYTATGTYTVSLTVSGPGGSDTETKVAYITVWDPASADFTASPLSGTAPLTVTFTDQSGGDIVSWTWDLGDGGISGARHPAYTYENVGTYTVSLTVSGPGGSDAEIKADYITASGLPPTATIDSISPNPATQGQDTIIFNGSSVDNDESGAYIVTYEWRSDLDGWLSDREDFTVTASELSTGTHTITFKVQDDESEWSQEVTRTLTVQSPGADVRTLILVNRQKLETLYSASEADQVMNKLSALTAHDSVKGRVVQVENDATVAAAYAAWDADPTSTAKANAVTAAIRDVVDAQWAAHPDLEYLVIVGDDRVIPFRRVLDQTRYPERHYRSVSCDSVTGAALCDDMTLTDDYYADAVPTVPDSPGWDGHDLYIPDLGTGRLIETPSEIIAQIDAFMASDGVAASNAIVTGYDFVQDGAQGMCAALSGDGIATDCTLIGENWGRTDFIAHVLNTRNDVASINGHANHYIIGIPSGSVSSSDVAGATADHMRAIFYTVGCHSGLNVPPTNPYQPLDTAQALIQHQANYVANTGYGWGYLFSIGLSERLMLDFTERLVYSQSATLGQALAAAKQEYYLNEGCFNYYDEKIMIESTLYGLPMYRYTTPTVTAAHLQAQDQEAKVLTEEEVSVLGDGLTINSFSYQFPPLTAESTDNGTYYTLDGLVHSDDGEPIQPKYTAGLSFPQTKAHGVVFKSGAYADVTSFDPVVDRAITETTTLAEPAFSAPGWYPSLPHRLNRLERGDRLVTLLGQFDPNTQVERIYDRLSFDIYYHTSSSDWTAPSITSVSSGLAANSATVIVEASDPSGIEAIVVAYTDGNGTWDSASLTESGGTWSGSFPATADTEFFVQAVDKAGNVAVDDNDGRYFKLSPDGGPSTIFLPVILKNF